jgi:hypothetical protein
MCTLDWPPNGVSRVRADKQVTGKDGAQLVNDATAPMTTGFLSWQKNFTVEARQRSLGDLMLVRLAEHQMPLHHYQIVSRKNTHHNPHMFTDEHMRAWSASVFWVGQIIFRQSVIGRSSRWSFLATCAKFTPMKAHATEKTVLSQTLTGLERSEWSCGALNGRKILRNAGNGLPLRCSRAARCRQFKPAERAFLGSNRRCRGWR